MENQEILKLLKLTATLMELHDENPFKVRPYQNAVFKLEKSDIALSGMTLPELEKIEGIGKGIAARIIELDTTGRTDELAILVEKTPKGIIELLNIKGIGPKKVRTIWKELNVTNKEELLLACNENKVSALKGFGDKTQEIVKQALVFVTAQKDKFLYAEAEPFAYALEKTLKEAAIAENISLSGEIRRRLEVIETVQIIVGSTNTEKGMQLLDTHPDLTKNPKTSGPFAWRGTHISGLKVEIKFYSAAEYGTQLYIHSSSKEHLAHKTTEGLTLLQFAGKNKVVSEAELFTKLNVPYIEPELREGFYEWEAAQTGKLPELITYQNLKGVLHNHCTYSDGSHTLEQMALFAKSQGFEYLGISDHSKSAFYANGLYENRIKEQHNEINALNIKLAPFKIFKGIESDILNDGSLDYDDNVLASFDFIVASVHSNLKMTQEKATARLLRAIENPYTTILGHATGRLLLKREGYPIDYKKIIDACAANNVVIEINANPRRLDMDWRWIIYALQQNVMISINPDAHAMEGYLDMQYGVHMGRKAGLTKAMTLNALSLPEISAIFEKKRSMAAKS